MNTRPRSIREIGVVTPIMDVIKTKIKIYYYIIFIIEFKKYLVYIIIYICDSNLNENDII